MRGQKKGFKHSEETKKIISEHSKQKWKDKNYRDKFNKSRRETWKKNGYVNSPETRKKLSEIMIKKIKNGEIDVKKRSPFIKGHKTGMLGKKHSGKTKEKMRKSNKGISKKTRIGHKEWRKYFVMPVKDTSIEIKIQRFLTQLHIEFYTHKYISEITHAYQCDIFIPKTKTIIECDGCFFHACPDCNVGKTEWTKKRRILDKIRTEELIKNGFKVIRIWEHDIKIMELNDFKKRLS